MAKVKELTLPEIAKSRELGQIEFGPIKYEGPLKVRIDGRFIPAFTIDLAKKKPKKGKGMLDIIKPVVTILLGDKAYQIRWGEDKIVKVDPSIFDHPTILDRIQKIGFLPFVLVSGILGILLLMKILRK